MKKFLSAIFAGLFVLVLFSLTASPGYAAKVQKCNTTPECKPINNVPTTCKAIVYFGKVCVKIDKLGQKCETNEECQILSGDSNLFCLPFGSKGKKCAPLGKPGDKCIDSTHCVTSFNDVAIECKATQYSTDIFGDKAKNMKACLPSKIFGEKCSTDEECNTDPDMPRMHCEAAGDFRPIAGDFSDKKYCEFNFPISLWKRHIPPPLPPCAKEGELPCKSFKTAFGDISTDPGKFISKIFGILLAASGAIALLLIIRAGYRIMLSEGNPEKIKEGRDQLIAAIVGLLILIFAFVFLQLIGVDILKIPGFDREGSATPPGSGPPGTITDLSCMEIYRIGSSGRCVQNVRSFLNLVPADGPYDQQTEDAVKKFQQESGIYPDGLVGPCTTGKMRGFTVNPICSGPLDEATLRQFQTDNGLIIDGKFGGCTWRALIGEPIPESCTR